MGRPINKRYIGNVSTDGQQIQMSAYIPGDSGYDYAYIVAQKATSTYKVASTSDRRMCRYILTRVVPSSPSTSATAP